MKVRISGQFFDLIEASPGEYVINIDSDARCDWIEALSDQLKSAINNYPAFVGPHAVKNSCEAFIAAAELADELGNPDELFADITSWESDAAASVFSRFPIGDESPNKKFALSVSEVMPGTDAQRLYRFTVLVTKLA